MHTGNLVKSQVYVSPPYILHLSLSMESKYTLSLQVSFP